MNPGLPAHRRHTLATESVAEAYLALLKDRGIDYLYVGAGTDTAPVIVAYARAESAGLAFPAPIVACMRTWPSEWRTASTWSRGGRRRDAARQRGRRQRGVRAAQRRPRAGAHPVTAGRTPLFQEGRLGSRTHARALIRPRMLKRCKPRVRRCALVHSMLAARSL